ncbi:MAG: orotidine-5'-phosphate decarboxylase [Spirochaetaceae bacterium]|nr:orotidine-5'-phosphate decarboxylase [Spirochaetaceae bacterium]
MSIHAMQRLQESGIKNGPLCVGLDTDPSYLPQSVLAAYSSAAQAVVAYNKAIIQRIAADSSGVALAACCKVQIAYYEAMGLEGMRAYCETLRAVKAAGLPVIADIKRGDIADTARAYACAHFSGDFEADIITLNPYMGFDTLEPFVEYAHPDKGVKGMFVLLRTSNPGMADVEKLPIDGAAARFGGEAVLDRVGAELSRISASFRELYPAATCSPVGAVVGCTEESDARQLRDAYPDIYFLIPGYGAQGGAARIAATLLDRAGGTVNSSRGILCAWKTDEKLAAKAADNRLTVEDIADSATAAAAASKTDLLSAVRQLKP